MFITNKINLKFYTLLEVNVDDNDDDVTKEKITIVEINDKKSIRYGCIRYLKFFLVSF